MDVFTKTKRSSVMAAIRHRGNHSTERTFAALLRCSRISGWKLHFPKIIGKPDFYFPRQRIAVFVDGCFWHACPKCFRAPRQNASFWKNKVERNRKRDQKVTRGLRRVGVKVLRLWEYDLEKRTFKVHAILDFLRSASRLHSRESSLTA